MKTGHISFKLLIIIILLIVKVNSHAQQFTKKTEGSLISINYIDQTIDTSGIGYWENTYFENDHFSSNYRFSFRMNSSHYLVNNFWNDSYIYDINSYSGFRFETIEQGLILESFSRSNGWMDIIEPYMVSRNKLLERNNGIWLLKGQFGNSFYTNSDSLKGAELLYVCGKIGEEYLIVDFDTLNYGKYNFFLDSLNNSPKYSKGKEIEVIFEHENIDPISDMDFNNPLDLTYLSDDLYIASRTGGQYLDLYTFRNDSLIMLKQFSDPEFLIDYRVINNSLYCYNNRKLVKMNFDFFDSTFVHDSDIERNVSYGLLAFDINSDNYAYTKNDSLFVGSLITKERIYEIDLRGFNIKDVKPVIDSPYVYLHQIDKITDVENNVSELPKQFSLFQNYPNPFNPSTIIKYRIPVVAAYYASTTNRIVTLKVYDVLGREVATLVDEEQPYGEYEVTFDARSINQQLSSGVYYYQLCAGSFVQTQKMLLLK